MRPFGPLIVTVGSLVCPAAAWADNGTAKVVEGGLAAVAIAELGIPDVRLVFGADDHRWVLSWPIVLSTLKAEGDAFGVALTPFIEPQYQPTREALRLGAGIRVTSFSKRGDLIQASPLIEAGGLVASDGSGVFAGGGLALGSADVGITFGLVGRAIQTGQERRYDLALDLHFPLTSDEY